MKLALLIALDLFAYSIVGVARGAPVNGRVLIGIILRHIRGGLEFTQIRDKVLRIINLVRTHDSSMGAVSIGFKSSS